MSLKRYIGIGFEASDSDLGIVEDRASRFGKVLSKESYNGKSKIFTVIPEYLTKEFLNPLKGLDIDFKMETNEIPNYNPYNIGVLSA